MMKIVPPKSFYYKGGEKAVLLLHSFTSNTSDMKKLGRYLQENKYSCHAPLYRGHGLTAEELITYGPSDWWKDVLNGYQLLKDEGFKKIAVIGLSLGGVFALKVGQELNVNGVVTMSVPTHREVAVLQERVFHYAKRYKQIEGKNGEQINLEMTQIQNMSVASLVEFQQLIDATIAKLARITSPISIFYGELDELLYKESANFVYRSVTSSQKSIKGYPNSTHLMTIGSDIEEVNKDILTFLNNLIW
ncbi:alpha/beta hydrolase [Halobacillus shinanisalinarum]|uniref:Alpha/beta hydrolase n=1 Tax=Halobacillus shinanisalinarum TaxID=2932258 RepID=A0ABY4H779_9BACI|nr:alpha/beta fold hydrolase [Halobacillus shinanisalinarum]UOQ94837.1 alpha/beta hydrolase [Halobacillus shinanisalinarum]